MRRCIADPIVWWSLWKLWGIVGTLLCAPILHWDNVLSSWSCVQFQFNDTRTAWMLEPGDAQVRVPAVGCGVGVGVGTAPDGSRGIVHVQFPLPPQWLRWETNEAVDRWAHELQHASGPVMGLAEPANTVATGVLPRGTIQRPPIAGWVAGQALACIGLALLVMDMTRLAKGHCSDVRCKCRRTQRMRFVDMDEF